MGNLFDLESGITAGLLRLGIAQGGYVAYVEMADSGVGFQYCVTRDGVRISEGRAPDFSTAKQKAEEELRLLCSVPLQ
ncbi:MAG: hypothetical protein ACM3JB_08895 [Acidobacteriaceae bacterium]